MPKIKDMIAKELANVKDAAKAGMQASAKSVDTEVKKPSGFIGGSMKNLTADQEKLAE